MQSTHCPVLVYLMPLWPFLQGLPWNFVSPACLAARFAKSGCCGGGLTRMLILSRIAVAPDLPITPNHPSNLDGYRVLGLLRHLPKFFVCALGVRIDSGV